MREGRMDDGAREGKGGRLECLLSFWLRLPQWTQQAVALLKSQYRENEWRERQRRMESGREVLGTRRGRMHHRVPA